MIVFPDELGHFKHKIEVASDFLMIITLFFYFEPFPYQYFVKIHTYISTE